MNENRKRQLMIDLYGDLKSIGLCDTKYDFSRNWLNKSKRYTSSVINENREISIDPLIFAMARMRYFSDQLKDSGNNRLNEKADQLDGIQSCLLNELIDMQVLNYVVSRRSTIVE